MSNKINLTGLDDIPAIMRKLHADKVACYTELAPNSSFAIDNVMHGHSKRKDKSVLGAKKVERMAEQASRIVNHLTKYSKKSEEPEPKEKVLNKVSERALRMMTEEYPEPVSDIKNTAKAYSLLSGTGPKTTTSNEIKLSHHWKKHFKNLDVHKSGYVSYDDFSNALLTAAAPRNTNYSVEANSTNNITHDYVNSEDNYAAIEIRQAHQLAQHLDKDKTGLVNYKKLIPSLAATVEETKIKAERLAIERLKQLDIKTLTDPDVPDGPNTQAKKLFGQFSPYDHRIDLNEAAGNDVDRRFVGRRSDAGNLDSSNGIITIRDDANDIGAYGNSVRETSFHYHLNHPQKAEEEALIKANRKFSVNNVSKLLNMSKEDNVYNPCRYHRFKKFDYNATPLQVDGAMEWCGGDAAPIDFLVQEHHDFHHHNGFAQNQLYGEDQSPWTNTVLGSPKSLVEKGIEYGLHKKRRPASVGGKTGVLLRGGLDNEPTLKHEKLDENIEKVVNYFHNNSIQTDNLLKWDTKDVQRQKQKTADLVNRSVDTYNSNRHVNFHNQFENDRRSKRSGGADGITQSGETTVNVFDDQSKNRKRPQSAPPLRPSGKINRNLSDFVVMNEHNEAEAKELEHALSHELMIPHVKKAKEEEDKEKSHSLRHVLTDTTSKPFYDAGHKDDTHVEYMRVRGGGLGGQGNEGRGGNYFANVRNDNEASVNQHNHIHAANSIITQLSNGKRLGILRHKLKDCDASKSGYVSFSEFHEALVNKLGLRMPVGQLKAYYDANASSRDKRSNQSNSLLSTTSTMGDAREKVMDIEEFIGDLQARTTSKLFGMHKDAVTTIYKPKKAHDHSVCGSVGGGDTHKQRPSSAPSHSRHSTHLHDITNHSMNDVTITSTVEEQRVMKKVLHATNKILTTDPLKIFSDIAKQVNSNNGNVSSLTNKTHRSVTADRLYSDSLLPEVTTSQFREGLKYIGVDLSNGEFHTLSNALLKKETHFASGGGGGRGTGEHIHSIEDVNSNEYGRGEDVINVRNAFSVMNKQVQAIDRYNNKSRYDQLTTRKLVDDEDNGDVPVKVVDNARYHASYRSHPSIVDHYHHHHYDNLLESNHVNHDTTATVSDSTVVDMTAANMASEYKAVERFDSTKEFNLKWTKLKYHIQDKKDEVLCAFASDFTNDGAHFNDVKSTITGKSKITLNDMTAGSLHPVNAYHHMNREKRNVDKKGSMVMSDGGLVNELSITNDADIAGGDDEMISEAAPKDPRSKSIPWNSLRKTLNNCGIILGDDDMHTLEQRLISHRKYHAEIVEGQLISNSVEAVKNSEVTLGQFCDVVGLPVVSDRTERKTELLHPYGDGHMRDGNIFAPSTIPIPSHTGPGSSRFGHNNDTFTTSYMLGEEYTGENMMPWNKGNKKRRAKPTFSSYNPTQPSTFWELEHSGACTAILPTVPFTSSMSAMGTNGFSHSSRKSLSEYYSEYHVNPTFDMSKLRHDYPPQPQQYWNNNTMNNKALSNSRNMGVVNTPNVSDASMLVEHEATVRTSRSTGRRSDPTTSLNSSKRRSISAPPRVLRSNSGTGGGPVPQVAAAGSRPKARKDDPDSHVYPLSSSKGVASALCLYHNGTDANVPLVSSNGTGGLGSYLDHSGENMPAEYHHRHHFANANADSAGFRAAVDPNASATKWASSTLSEYITNKNNSNKGASSSFSPRGVAGAGGQPAIQTAPSPAATASPGSLSKLRDFGNDTTVKHELSVARQKTVNQPSPLSAHFARGSPNSNSNSSSPYFTLRRLNSTNPTMQSNAQSGNTVKDLISS